jgi:UDP-4-amino-4,6-dideoxy-N-acetyl-beta-L-altrosamine N-acetyltransferase
MPKGYRVVLIRNIEFEKYSAVVFGSRSVLLADAEDLLRWRNSPSVAPFMFNDRPIHADEHEAWVSRILHDEPTALRRVFTANDVPVGFFSLTSIDYSNKCCVWGGYLAPDVPRGQGVGRAMMDESLRIAFTERGMHRVVVEAIVGNDRAIALYESVGFKREGVLRDRAEQQSGFVDVVILGLLESEWIKPPSS